MLPVKVMRERAGLSQSEFADRSGVNFRTLQHYEQGSKNIDGAKLSTLIKIAKALNCKIADIVIDEDLKLLCKERNI